MSSRSQSKFPAEEASTTSRMRPDGVFVLVVHDADVESVGVWDCLHDEYIVRDVTTAFDALEWLSGTTLACVVCVLGNSLRALDFETLVVRLSERQARHIVFIAPFEHVDIEHLKSAGRDWLAMPVKPEELVALVRAVSAR